VSCARQAHEIVETMRKKDDEDGADVWLRIIVAIGTLGEPPTERVTNQD
jgi:hypothetical protein